MSRLAWQQLILARQDHDDEAPPDEPPASGPAEADAVFDGAATDAGAIAAAGGSPEVVEVGEERCIPDERRSDDSQEDSALVGGASNGGRTIAWEVPAAAPQVARWSAGSPAFDFDDDASVSSDGAGSSDVSDAEAPGVDGSSLEQRRGGAHDRAGADDATHAAGASAGIACDGLRGLGAPAPQPGRVVPGPWGIGTLEFFVPADSGNCASVAASEASRPRKLASAAPAAPLAPPTPDVEWAASAAEEEKALYEVVQARCMVHEEPRPDAKVCTRKSKGARFYAYARASLGGWQRLACERGWVCLDASGGDSGGGAAARAVGAGRQVRRFELKQGAEVTIVGLKSRVELNDTRGVVFQYVEEKQRYAVRVSGGTKEKVLLRPACLRLPPRAPAPGFPTPAAAAAPTPAPAAEGDAPAAEDAESRQAAAADSGVLSFDIRVRADCDGVACSSRQCQWFFFGLRGELDRGQKLRFRMLGLSRFRKLQSSGAKCGSLLTDGFRPVFKDGERNGWRFTDGPSGVERHRDGSWAFVFEHAVGRAPDPGEELLFALTFPYPLARARDHWRGVRRALVQAGAYARRELLVRTPGGRRVDLLTVTWRSGGTRDRAPGIPGLEPPAQSRRRPRRFPGRRSVFVSARVHPGETPASFMLEGLLDFLAAGGDAAQVLLRRYVFHVVPVLNPDGVELGHHRLDSTGVNLNRVYGRADPTQHPSVVAAEAACRAAHEGQGGVRLYLDLHAHSNRRGVFLLGNADTTGGADAAMGRVFGYALARRCHLFEYSQSDFGDTVPGTGKSTIGHFLGSSLCFTLEGSYFRGHHSLAPFDPAAWRLVGRSCLEALLDIDHLENPPLPRSLPTALELLEDLHRVAAWFAAGADEGALPELSGLDAEAPSRARPLFGLVLGPAEGHAISRELLLQPELVGRSVEVVEARASADGRRLLRLHEHDGGGWLGAEDVALQGEQRGRFFYGVLRALTLAEGPSPDSPPVRELLPGEVLEVAERRVIGGALRVRAVSGTSAGSSAGWASEYRRAAFDPRLGGAVQLMRLRCPPLPRAGAGPRYAFPL